MAAGFCFLARMSGVLVEIDATGWTQPPAASTAQYMRIVNGLDHLKHGGQNVDDVGVGQNADFKRLTDIDSDLHWGQATAAVLCDICMEIDFQIERRQLCERLSDDVDGVHSPVTLSECLGRWCQFDIDWESMTWCRNELSNTETHGRRRTATSAVRLASFTS